MSATPTNARAHFLFCTGNGLGVPKWGSTNVYTEDEAGNPVYDFTIWDEIFDAWVSRGIRPFVELGFMPRDLTTQGAETQEEYERTGWSYPPKDYEKWRDLCYTAVKHCVERYGRDEVATWYWELWNEPDIFYWKGTVEEYCKLYDYTVDGVKAAFPEARVGGPATTHRGIEFFERFLEHVTRGTNHVTGQKGTPIDFISFHVKGGGYQFQRRAPKQLVSRKQIITSIDRHLEVIDKFPELSGLRLQTHPRHPQAARGESDGRPDVGVYV